MTSPLKANDNNASIESDLITLPLPPLSMKDAVQLEVYARFMRHVRLVPNKRANIKILSAIQFTSDMMELNDALVSKTLADMGLRAPRSAFPEAYLEFVDHSLMQSGWDARGPCASTIEMKAHWDHLIDDRFAVIRRDYGAGQELPL